MSKNSVEVEVTAESALDGIVIVALGTENGEKVIIESAGRGKNDDVHVGFLPLPAEFVKHLENNDICVCPLFKIPHLHMKLSKADILKTWRGHSEKLGDETKNGLIHTIRRIERAGIEEDRKHTAEKPLDKRDSAAEVAWSGLIEALEKAGRDPKAANK